MRAEIRERESLTNTILMENNDYIKKKKQELTENIKNSEEELKELRSMCKHEDIKVKNINPESGASHLRKVCDTCGQILGFPTNDELRESGYMPK
jgi:hypothetical protein